MTSYLDEAEVFTYNIYLGRFGWVVLKTCAAGVFQFFGFMFVMGQEHDLRRSESLESDSIYRQLDSQHFTLGYMGWSVEFSVRKQAASGTKVAQFLQTLRVCLFRPFWRSQ